MLSMEVLFKKYFSKSSWSKRKQFCSDVKHTLLGFKPALLIDCLCPDAPRIQQFLQELIQLGLPCDTQNCSVISIVVIGEDVLIVNHSAMSGLVMSGSRPIFLDVTKGNTQPIIMDGSKGQPIISFSHQLLPETLHNSQVEIAPIVAFPMPTSASLSAHTNPEPVPNLCSVFGYLLHYPVVYWFDTEKGHALDMEELLLHRVTISHGNREEDQQASCYYVCHSKYYV